MLITQNQPLWHSLADGRSEIDDPVLLEVVGWKDRVFALHGYRTFPLFQALTIRLAGRHLDGDSLFQVDVLNLVHLEKNIRH